MMPGLMFVKMCCLDSPNVLCRHIAYSCYLAIMSILHVNIGIEYISYFRLASRVATSTLHPFQKTSDRVDGVCSATSVLSDKLDFLEQLGLARPILPRLKQARGPAGSVASKEEAPKVLSSAATHALKSLPIAMRNVLKYRVVFCLLQT